MMLAELGFTPAAKRSAKRQTSCGVNRAQDALLRPKHAPKKSFAYRRR
jgi:hypothetical protein